MINDVRNNLSPRNTSQFEFKAGLIVSYNPVKVCFCFNQEFSIYTSMSSMKSTANNDKN